MIDLCIKYETDIKSYIHIIKNEELSNRVKRQAHINTLFKSVLVFYYKWCRSLLI